MSDLQCPPRLYLGRPSDESQVVRWRQELAPEHVAVEDLRDGPADLGSVADRYRGEGVLVLVSTPVLAGLSPGDLWTVLVDGEGMVVRTTAP